MADARLPGLDRRQHGALRDAGDAARAAQLGAGHGALRASPKALLECHRTLTTADFRAELRAIRIPALVVHGEHDVYLSETRDMAAARAFVRSAQVVTHVEPKRVTTDGHDAYPGAIRAERGAAVAHRTSRYFNNHLEPDHRGIEGRYRPLRGFTSVPAARRFCRADDEIRTFLRPRSARGQRRSRGQRRWSHRRRVTRRLGLMDRAA